MLDDRSVPALIFDQSGSEDLGWDSVLKPLRKRAVGMTVVGTRGTASAFASWVFECQHGRSSTPSSDLELTAKKLEFGRFAHAHVEQFWAAYRTVRLRTRADEKWSLIYSDPHDGSAETFQASCLAVNGAPLRCKPDVVLRSERTGEILIIERKFSSLMRKLERGGFPLSPSLWASLRAQLWCYSLIDLWADAPEVYLVGQIFELDSSLANSSFETIAAPTWRRSDESFCQPMAQLFRLWLDQPIMEDVKAAPPSEKWPIYRAVVEYYYRDIAKLAGFRWDSQRRVWLKRMAPDEARALPFRVERYDKP